MSRSFTVRPSAKSSIQPKKSQNSAQSKKPQQMESEGNLDGVGVEEKTNNDFDQRSIRCFILCLFTYLVTLFELSNRGQNWVLVVLMRVCIYVSVKQGRRQELF